MGFNSRGPTKIDLDFGRWPARKTKGDTKGKSKVEVRSFRTTLMSKCKIKRVGIGFLWLLLFWGARDSFTFSSSSFSDRTIQSFLCDCWAMVLFRRLCRCVGVMILLVRNAVQVLWWLWKITEATNVAITDERRPFI